MKIILVGIVTFYMLLAVAHEGSARSFSRYGDITIETVDGIIHCDTMVCPKGSQSCHVTKRNDPKNSFQIERKRTCYDSNGTILKEQTLHEPNPSGNNVNQNVVSGGGDRKLTPEEEKQLQEELRNMEREIEEQVAADMRDLENNLAPFRDGSFDEYLEDYIDDQIHSGFGKNFPF